MVQAEHFKGRLGFKSRTDTLLNQGMIQTVDMMDDYGHPPAMINTRAPGRIELESDQYRVILRLRRLPLRMDIQIPDGIPAPTIFLDVTIERLFPKGSDREITELLLAVLLRRLTQSLSPLLVFWQNAPKAMSSTDFLGVFESQDRQRAEARDTNADARQAALLSRTVTPSRPVRKAHAHTRPVSGRNIKSPSPFQGPAQTIPKSRSCFSPIDRMADNLEQECNRHAKTASLPGDQVIDLTDLRAADRNFQRQHILTWAVTGLVAMMSAPVAILLLILELMRGSQLKPHTHVVTAAVFLGLLQGTGMVQAAARVLMLPAQ